MDDEYILVDEIINDDLADRFDYDADMAYETWRDDWSMSLMSNIVELKKDFVDNKKSYYHDSDERFVEHTIEELLRVFNCNIVANGQNVVVTKVKNKTY